MNENMPTEAALYSMSLITGTTRADNARHLVNAFRQNYYAHIHATTIVLVARPDKSFCTFVIFVLTVTNIIIVIKSPN